MTLDGDKARDFISYQDPLESDADMIGRRQRFLQALLKALGENNAFLLQRGPFRMLRSLLRTNLPARALGSFVDGDGALRFGADGAAARAGHHALAWTAATCSSPTRTGSC